MAKIEGQEIILNGTREELIEWNYNRMIELTHQNHGDIEIGSTIRKFYRTMAEVNADMVIAQRPKGRKRK